MHVFLLQGNVSFQNSNLRSRTEAATRSQFHDSQSTNDDADLTSLVSHFAICTDVVTSLFRPALKMRLIEVVLVVLVILLANDHDATAASKNDISATIEHNNLRRLLTTEESRPHKLSATQEERLNSGVIASGEGGRTAAGVTPTTTTNKDGTITNSKYYNNGLLQRFERWWKGFF